VGTGDPVRVSGMEGVALMIYYIDPKSGDEDGDGSEVRPWKNYLQALKCWSSGDVFVLAGPSKDPGFLGTWNGRQMTYKRWVDFVAGNMASALRFAIQVIGNRQRHHDDARWEILAVQAQDECQRALDDYLEARIPLNAKVEQEA